MAVYNVMTGYSAANNGSTDDTTAIANAISAANSAGGGIVYFPAGTGYKLNTRYDPSGHPNQILPTLGNGVTLEGEGWKASKLLPSISYDVITLDSTEQNAILRLGILPTAVLSSGAGIRIRNCASCFVDQVAINDTGFAYGANGQVWVTGQYTPHTGAPNVGIRVHGSNGYKTWIQNVEVNGAKVGFEVGTYNTSNDWPQGINFWNTIAGRCEFGYAVYAGDAIGFEGGGALQCLHNGFLVLGKSGQPANVGLLNFGVDTCGDEGIKFDNSLGGVSYSTGFNNVWAGNCGHASVRTSGTAAASKGVLIASGIDRLDVFSLNCAVNGGDGAELTAGVHLLVDNSKFNNNGQVQSTPPYTSYSGLYIPNGCVNAVIRNNLFDGASYSSYVGKQGYGLWVSQTVSGLVLIGNRSLGNNSQNYHVDATALTSVENYYNF